MKFLACHLLLFFIYSVSGDNTLKNCGKSKVPLERIVGGEEAQAGQFPWMVPVYEKTDNGFSFKCEGAILNEYWIVSAAHCFHYPDDLRRYYLFAGVHNRNKTTSSVQLIIPSKIVVHQMYKSDSVTYDIALVKSSTRINLNSMYINGICLPDCATNPSGNATVTGWGIGQCDEAPSDDVLKQVEIPIIDWKYCKDIYGSIFSDYQYLQEVPTLLCAGKEGGKSPCQTDSGGPLFQYNKDGAAVLIGTVAAGYKNYPAIYMKISAFKSWMERVMELNPNEGAKCPIHK